MKPDFYEPNTMKWLYFGWENDESKSISTMGGALYPGGANAEKHKDDKPICFTVTSDGREYTPDERSADCRINTSWYQADGYMNSPVSEWDAGNIRIKIQHIPNRIEEKATAVFTQVTLSNNENTAAEVKLNVSADTKRLIPLNFGTVEEGDGYFVYSAKISANGTVKFDFVSIACGEISEKEIPELEGFDKQYFEVKKYYDKMIAGNAHPVLLPNESVQNSYINSMIVMWETMVKNGGDYEMRGSAGNRAGLHGYDTYFAHDVPNMAEQFIRDGRFELAYNIMESSYYQKLYIEHGGNLDAIPKFIIPYAALWQAAGDMERVKYFSEKVKYEVMKAAKTIEKYMTGPDGLMDKSESLDNMPYDYLVVDNFTALHGLCAYKYLCREWGWYNEEKWAEEKLETLNSALNTMLDETMERRNADWYMCAMNDDSGFWQRHINGNPRYDGNWLGSTFMMSTFPWDAFLRGFELGGTWEKQLERSVDYAIELKEKCADIPENSWGAWWGHEYGTVYNVGQSVPLLYSEKYRTRVIPAYEWLIDNQTAPYQWTESFDMGQTANDWTAAAIDYETWGLGFLRQGLLEAFVSVKTNGDVIIGRGVTDEWMFSGVPMIWRNININNGRKINSLTIVADSGKRITVRLDGDDALVDIIVNLPAMKNGIEKASSGEIDGENGRLILSGDTKSVEITITDKNNR